MSGDTLRGLTLKVHHAACVWMCGKDVENRKNTLCQPGTRVAIHAGAWPTSQPALERSLDELRTAAAEHAGIIVTPQRDGRKYTGRVYLQRARGPVTARPDQYIDLPRSAIVALATVSEILPATDKPARPWHLPNHVGHVLSDVVVLRHPLRFVSGQLGAWGADHHVEALRDRERLARGFVVNGIGRPTARGALASRDKVREDSTPFRNGIWVRGTDEQLDEWALMRLVEAEEKLDREARRPWSTEPLRSSLATRGQKRRRARKAGAA